MIESITMAAKIKALIAVLSLLFLGSLYEPLGNNDVSIPIQETKDPFVQDIQVRSDLVYNAVSEAINKQGEQQPLTFKQTCESSLAFIRNERLDTNTGYNTLDASRKVLIDNYRLYLDESANAVIVCMSGEKPDLTEMLRLKNELY